MTPSGRSGILWRFRRASAPANRHGTAGSARSAARMALCALASLTVATGCPDEVDRAAKKRIFSPEEPPRSVRAAAQPIDVSRLASDPELLRRVLTMPPEEAFERLGPHRLKGTASWEWKLGGKTVRLSENREVEQAGPNDFLARTENDRDRGFEIIRTGTRTFARAKYMPFRERLRDRGAAEKMRAEIYGGLRTFSSLLDNRLGVSRDGEEKVEGRQALRFAFELAPEPLWPAVDPSLNLPPVEYPAGGPDPDTQRRLDFATSRVPESVKGKLWVDAQSAVPLKVELTATVRAPGVEGKDAHLSLTLRQKLEAVGAKLVIAPPKQYLPDEDRPDGVAAALKRFDIARPDAGSAEPDAPADEAEVED